MDYTQSMMGHRPLTIGATYDAAQMGHRPLSIGGTYDAAQMGHRPLTIGTIMMASNGLGYPLTPRAALSGCAPCGINGLGAIDTRSAAFIIPAGLIALGAAFYITKGSLL